MVVKKYFKFLYYVRIQWHRLIISGSAIVPPTGLCCVVLCCAVYLAPISNHHFLLTLSL